MYEFCKISTLPDILVGHVRRDVYSFTPGLSLSLKRLLCVDRVLSKFKVED